MNGWRSIFLDFNLPNPTTWFYFSFLLAVALFFKFARVLSMRNWDVATIFLLVPGMLFLQEARTDGVINAATLIGNSGQAIPLAGTGLSSIRGVATIVLQETGPSRLVRFSYL